MCCPPRIKTFLWRALDNNLPVRTNLIRRGVEVDNECPLCGLEEESIGHLFFDCQVARGIWQDMGVALQSMPPWQSSMVFSSLLANQDAVECGRHATAI